MHIILCSFLSNTFKEDAPKLSNTVRVPVTQIYASKVGETTLNMSD